MDKAHITRGVPLQAGCAGTLEEQLLFTQMGYDITIWEQIRSTVQWKTLTLVKDINKEISNDFSLLELQGKHPVPWQLREVMRQRAHSWVQHLYDSCCDVYKRSGKELSAEFDRAVWAYCIEPFIMGQKEADIHHETMSGFLELLLCAVGSPRERRRFLTVSQKDCCLGVRKEVYETWYHKLHHLPLRINEALAAMAGYNAMERRAARIVRGLPPDDPPPPPSTPVHPLVQPEESLPPRAFNSDSKTPPSTIEAAIDVGRMPETQTPPLHIDPLLKKTVPDTKAPLPISDVGGRGAIHGPKPTEVLSDLPVDYPRTLVARTFVIIGEAVRKFPVQTRTLELCKYVISELTRHFREALQNNVFRQDQALSRMHDLLHYLLVHNCDGEWRRSEIRKEVLKSDEWLTLAREIAGKIEDAPESGALMAATWDAIDISFLSEERVQIRNGATTETRNYTEFGFEDGRSGKPNLAWKTLLALAAERGILQNAAKTGQKWLEVERRIQEIRKVLREHFQISSDPIPFVEGTGYRALFKISCRPSFDT